MTTFSEILHISEAKKKEKKEKMKNTSRDRNSRRGMWESIALLRMILISPITLPPERVLNKQRFIASQKQPMPIPMRDIEAARRLL